MQNFRLKNLKKTIVALSGTFGARVFVYLMTAMILIYIVFDLLMIRSHHKIIVDIMVKEGQTITRLLADNVRLGVFSENVDLLSPPVQSTLEQREVMTILVIDREGKQLLKEGQSSLGSSQNCEEGLKKFIKLSRENLQQQLTFSQKDENCLVIGAPVLISHEQQAEQLYFDTDLSYPEIPTRFPYRLLGYVAIAFDEEALTKSRQQVFSEHVGLFIVFLIAASLVTLLIVRQAIRPINRLIALVKNSNLQVEAPGQIDLLDKSFSSLVNQLTEAFSTINQLHLDLEEVTSELIKTQEQERQRIALDLHDDVAQNLSSLRMTCDTLFDEMPKEASESLLKKRDNMSEQLKGCIQTVRHLSYDLQPPSLTQLGLAQAVRQLTDDFAAANQLEIDFLASGFEEFEPEYDFAINCYRIIQEALNNVKKHANASKVRIRLVASYPSIILRINDNGVGFDSEDKVAKASGGYKMGLQNMIKRTHLLNGRMKEFKSVPGGGTKILIEFPYPEKKDE